MPFTHPNCDVGAEADTFRDSLAQFQTKTVFDKHSDETNKTVIEYVNGEGDPPFIRYRLALEAVASYSAEEYEELEEVKPEHPAQAEE